MAETAIKREQLSRYSNIIRSLSSDPVKALQIRKAWKMTEEYRQGNRISTMTTFTYIDVDMVIYYICPACTREHTEQSKKQGPETRPWTRHSGSPLLTPARWNLYIVLLFGFFT